MAVDYIEDYLHIYRPSLEHPAAEEFGGPSIKDIEETLTFFQLAYAGQPYYGNEVVLGYLDEATDIVRIRNHAGHIAAAAIVINNRGIMIGSSWDTDRHGSRAESLINVLKACHGWRRQFWLTSSVSQAGEGVRRAARRAGAMQANDQRIVGELLEEAHLSDAYSLSEVNDVIVLKKARGRNIGYLQYLWHWPDIELTNNL